MRGRQTQSQAALCVRAAEQLDHLLKIFETTSTGIFQDDRIPSVTSRWWNSKCKLGSSRRVHHDAHCAFRSIQRQIALVGHVHGGNVVNVSNMSCVMCSRQA